MMPSGKVLFTTGRYGHTVKVVRRTRGTLVLRYTRDGTTTDKALGHHDLNEAKQQAKLLSLQLANVRATESGAPGAYRQLTVAGLMALYHTEVTNHKPRLQQKEDERRRILWTFFLTPRKLARNVTPADISKFIQRRRNGSIVVPGLALKKDVRPATIDGDVIFIQSVFNWAINAKLFATNPIAGSSRPDVGAQMRPMATHERYLKLMDVADRVHPRFALLLTAARALGWRISSLCAIDGSDIRRAPSTLAPYGEIRKNWKKDKELQHAWVPMSKRLREELDRAGILAVPGCVFPSETRDDQPMSKSYARDLLERAEAFAKLDALEGGDWHPWRRLWATERKHFPTIDVARAGTWADARTVERYQSADPTTTSAVMLFDADTATQPAEKKKRPTSKNESGATTGTHSRARRAKGA